MEFAKSQSESPVLIPTTDDDVTFVSRHVDALKPWVRFATAPREAVDAMVDKALLARRLEERGMPAPRTVSVKEHDDLMTSDPAWGVPFLLKPTESARFLERFPFKLFVVRNRSDLERASAMISGTGMKFVRQELIPARLHHEVYCLRRGGSTLAVVGYDRVRQFPPQFGTASFCTTCFRAEAVELSIRVLEEFSVEGLAAVELILDARDNVFKVIEVNPRTTLQNRLPAACGVEFEYLLYRVLLGETLSPLPGVPDGISWIDDFKDPLSALADFVQGRQRARAILRQYLRPKVHSLLDLRDPIPYAAGFVQFALRTLTALRALPAVVRPGR